MAELNKLTINGSNYTFEDDVARGLATTEASRAQAAEKSLQTAINGKVDKVAGKGLSTNDYTNDEKAKLAGLNNYDDTQVRQLIAQTNANFANYYTKAESYSATEVDTLLRTQRQGQFVVVNTLPAPSADTMFKIYLVPSTNPKTQNVKDEFVTLDNNGTYSWEQIGTTAVDLSGYSTTEEMNAAIANALASYYTKSEVDEALGGKQDTISDLSDIRSGAQAGSTAVQPSTLNNVVKNTVAESGVYDVSANNDNTKFESLSALLSSANLNTLIPTDIRKGGMSIKFVQSSDNKYVQYRLTKDEWSVNLSDWQKNDLFGNVVVYSKQIVARSGDQGIANAKNSWGKVLNVTVEQAPTGVTIRMGIYADGSPARYIKLSSGSQYISSENNITNIYLYVSNAESAGEARVKIAYGEFVEFTYSVNNALDSATYEIDELREDIDGVPNYTIGGWIARNGTIISNHDYAYSDYIDITAGDYITVKTGSSDMDLWICLYPTNGDNVETFQKTASSKERSITIPNGYDRLRFSFEKTRDAKVLINTTVIWEKEIFGGIKGSIGYDDRTTIPAYYFEHDYIKNKISAIQNLLEKCSVNGDAFIFQTDEHWEVNAQRSPALIKYIADRTGIGRLFDGGDTTNIMSPNGHLNPAVMDFEILRRKTFSGNIYHAVGNHEYISHNFDPADTRYSNWIDFSYFTKGADGIVYGDIDKHYYYVDNPQKKIRYIILSAYKQKLSSETDGAGNFRYIAEPDYDNEQLNWFTNTALDVSTGWTILVFTHFFMSVTRDGRTDDGYMINVRPYILDKARPFARAMLNYNGSGEIAAVLEGHLHWDASFTITDALADNPTTTGRVIPCIATACDAYNFTSSTEALFNRTVDSITEQAFDVYVIDKTTKKLTAVRIGAPAYDLLVADETGNYPMFGDLEYREVSYGNS